MAEAFRKYSVDRNTIMQSAAITELAIAAPEIYEEINEKHGKGEKLSSIVQKCQDAIVTDEKIADKIQTMKTDGKLLPIKKMVHFHEKKINKKKSKKDFKILR